MYVLQEISMWKHNVTVEGMKLMKTCKTHIFKLCGSGRQFMSWYNICNRIVYLYVIFLSLLQGLPQVVTRNRLSAMLAMCSCILLIIQSTNTAPVILWMKKLAVKGMLLLDSWQLSPIYWTLSSVLLNFMWELGCQLLTCLFTEW